MMPGLLQAVRVAYPSISIEAMRDGPERIKLWIHSNVGGSVHVSMDLLELTKFLDLTVRLRAALFPQAE